MRRLATLLLFLVLAPPAAAQDAATAPTRTVTADGIELGYRSIGSGRPIVFVMGLSGTIDAWDPTFLNRIARQGRRVIVFDNEGIGRSGHRSGTLSIRRMADDTAALIRVLKLGRPDVFGWSMGGMIAQSLAVRHPKLVRRLALAATAPGDGRATLPDGDVIAGFTDPAGSPARSLALLFPAGVTGAGQRYVANITRRRSPNLVPPREIVEAQVGATATWLAGNDPDGRKVSRLTLQVLVGGGQQDRVLPVPNQRHLADIIPGAERALYDNAAHGFFVQHAARFARRVDQFLDRRGARKLPAG